MDDNDFRAMTKRMVDGVIEQGEPCVTKTGQCVYRNESGNKCAVGHAIGDDDYHPNFDIEEMPVYQIAQDLGWELDRTQLNIMVDIQNAHDNAPRTVDFFVAGFKEFIGEIPYLQEEPAP